MDRNVADQIAYIYAFNAAGDPVSNDAANISANLYLDKSATPIVKGTWIEGQAPGSYYCNLTQAETDSFTLILEPSSTTGTTLIDPVVYYTTPVAGGDPGAAWDEAITSHATDGTFGAAFAGISAAGLNNLLGYFNAIMDSTAIKPGNIGGTYQPATHSLQAVRVQGDAAWSTADLTGIPADVWSAAQAGYTTPGQFGYLLDAQVSAAGGGTGLTAQETRDAMKLAPTAGAPAAGSIDAELDNIYVDTQRHDALIEDVAGDQYTSKALSQAPTGSGSTRVYVQGVSNGTLDYDFSMTTQPQVDAFGGNMETFWRNGDVGSTTTVNESNALVNCQAVIETNQLDTWFAAAGSLGSHANNCMFAQLTTRDGLPASFDSNTMSNQAFTENATDPDALVNLIWDEPRTGHDTAGTFGFYLDAQVSTAGGGSLTEASIWSYAAGGGRTLTAATNITSDGSAITTTTGVIGQVDALGSGAIKTSTYDTGAAPDNTQGAAVIAHGSTPPWTTGTAAGASSTIKIVAPTSVDIPESGTTQILIQLTVRDNTGAPINTDATPTLTAEDFEGNSLDANWAGAITNPQVGSYQRTYNVASTHPALEVLWKSTGDIGGEARSDSSTTDVTVAFDTSDVAKETTSQEIKTITDQFRFTIANQVDANALTGGGGGGDGYMLGFSDGTNQYAFVNDPNTWFGANFESFFQNNGNATAKIVDEVGTCPPDVPQLGPAYTTRARIENRFGQDNVNKWADMDNDQDAAAITARIDQEIEYASREIDGYLRGREFYKVPFTATVPVNIVDIATSMAGYRLWMARGVEAENDVIENAMTKAKQQLLGVVKRSIKLDTSKAKEDPATLDDM